MEDHRHPNQWTPQPGQKITWNTISGECSGKIVRVDEKFCYVKIDRTGKDAIVSVSALRKTETR